VEEQKLGVNEPTRGVGEPRPSVGGQNLTIADGFVGMLNAFVDPAGAAKRVPAPLSWLWPVILLSILTVVLGYAMTPYQLSLADAQISQRGLSAEQMERARSITHTITQFTIPAAPVIVMGFLALFAWLIGLVGSMLGMRSKFRDVFSLLAACSLIPALQSIATYIVIRAKGDEITTPEQLTPPFGLDIVLQNVHGPLLAILNYFSIFQIWYLIVLTLGLAYLTKSSKGKAFAAITPAWLIPLFLRIVQAMFQGTNNS
jgi:hypothetical protein